MACPYVDFIGCGKRPIQGAAKWKKTENTMAGITTKHGSFSLWLDNEEGSYNLVREIASEEIESALDAEKDSNYVLPTARVKTADRIKDLIQEASPLADGASLFHDLLNAAK